MQKYLMGIMLTLVLSALPVCAKEASTQKPLASYEWDYGKIDLMDYKIEEDVIGVVVDYTNTSDENVTPGWQISINLFQNGIEMESGWSFDIKGVKSEYKELRPGATLRFAEFFELESMDPVEVEFTPLFSYSDEPLYVTLDLDTKKVKESKQTKEESKKKNKSEKNSSGKSFIDDFHNTYDEIMDGAVDVYEETLDTYEDALDEYSNALSDVLGSLGF